MPTVLTEDKRGEKRTDRVNERLLHLPFQASGGLFCPHDCNGQQDERRRKRPELSSAFNGQWAKDTHLHPNGKRSSGPHLPQGGGGRMREGFFNPSPPPPPPLQESGRPPARSYSAGFNPSIALRQAHLSGRRRLSRRILPCWVHVADDSMPASRPAH